MCDVFAQVWHWVGQATTLLEEHALRCRSMMKHCEAFALLAQNDVSKKSYSVAESDESIFTSISNIITAINVNRRASDETLGICLLLRNRCEERVELIYRIPAERITVAALLERFDRTLGNSGRALFECDTSLHALFLRHRSLIDSLKSFSRQLGDLARSSGSPVPIATHEIDQLATSASKFADRLAENWMGHRHWLSDQRRLTLLQVDQTAKLN